ncbi:MAG: NAD-dependent succinate-semialdehyde dehydrogenase [Hydrogenophaga sp.]|uniref:NAD-dependent succinate-semialdehyde dehydrogenase n=1 Tax=Hydrogenophaga sp. TaxID=1904254 RepID=UPI003D0D949E
MADIYQIGSLIAGKEVTQGGRDTRPVLNPATGETIGMLSLARLEDIDAAAEMAQKGFQQWSALSAFERARCLQAVAVQVRADIELMASLLTAEQGKTLNEARGEVAGSADLFEWLAEEGKRLYGRMVPSRNAAMQQMVQLEPVGPVAAFSPWNYPLALAARKIAHALAAGCSVVIKPAEESPSAVLHLARICIRCGVPAEAIQVLFGVPAMVSERLIASRHIRKVSFTGSVAVGRHLAALAGQALKKVTFELGGHSAVIVMDDADVERAAQLSVASKFRNAGQICIAPSRFFVHDAVHDRFVAEFVRMSQKLSVGDGAKTGTDMGPLAHLRRTEAMQVFTQDAVETGARIAVGAPDRPTRAGFFWAPTVLTDVPDHARLMREEVFGPIAPMVRFNDLDAVIARANDVDFGLAGYAFTSSLKNARNIQDRLKVGMVGINSFSVTAPEMPFAGIKDSGLGVAQGLEGLLDHMNVKSVYRAD